MEELIENKIANSGLVTLDPAEFYDPTPKVELDIKPWLFQEMVVREKEFRTFLDSHDWEQYRGKYVCYFCSVDAIVPNWAWMLVAKYLQDNCTSSFNGTIAVLNELLISKALLNFDTSPYLGKRVLLKGCGDKELPVSIYGQITTLLLPVVKSLMFGEACSNVPIFKQKNS